jgi:DNA-binding CsgD family transcriptional regulator
MAAAVVGRDAQLATEWRFLSGVAGGPLALVITGEPGIGKTTLWRAATAAARDRGFRVLETRPVAADARSSFAAVADLVRDVDPERIRRLPEPQGFALDVVSRRLDPGSRRLDHRTVAAGLVGLLHDLSRDTPVLVAIDDGQWLDRSSARVLEFAARRIERAAVGFLVARRTAIGLPASPLGLEASLDPGRVELMPVSGLGVDDLATMIRAHLDRAFPRALVARIARITRGNPFFALEIARALPADHLLSAGLPLPESLTDLVRGRVGGLPAASRQALLAAASLTRPDRATVLAAVDADPAVRGDALDAAEEAGFVVVGERVEFTHPLLARIVHDGAPESTRRRVHGRLAALVSDPAERARHLALASGEPDEALAAILADAASRARARGAPDDALDLAELAHRLTPTDDRTRVHRRLVDVAEYRFHLGDLDGAADAVERVLGDEPAPGSRADALRLLGDTRLQQGSTADAIARYIEALPFAREDARLEAVLELGLAFATISSGDFAGVEPHAARGLAAAERAGDDALVAQALGVRSMIRFLRGGGLDDSVLERALVLEDHDRQDPIQMRPSLLVGLLRFFAGRLDEGREVLEDLARRTRERGEDPDLPWLGVYLAWLEVWAGNLDAADARARESVALADAPTLRAISHAFAALVDGWRGDRAACEAHAARAEVEAAASGYRLAPLWARWGRCILELSDGEHGRAVDVLGGLIPTAEAEGTDEPVRTPFVADAVEALVWQRELDRAEGLLAGLEAAADRLDRAWGRLGAARARVALLVARGDPDGAAELALRALADPAFARFPLERARLVLARARAERARRRRREAGTAYRDAEASFERAGARGWAHRARTERERLGLDRSHSVLTPSEAAIARLAADGLTNRAVAERLGVSPKTVEATLARVYAKLGIRSRAELGARRDELGAGARRGRAGV